MILFLQLSELTDILKSCSIAVKAARNALMPINHLPVELLTKIFSIVRRLNWKPSVTLSRIMIWQDVSSSADPLASVTLSHVCRHWRRVALNDPLLWVDIDERFLRSPIALNIIERSQSALLNVRLTAPCYPEIVRFVQEKGPRIHELHLLATVLVQDQAYARDGLTQLDFEALELEDLSMECETPVPLLFGDRTPRLKRLCLMHLPRLPPNRFSTLTHLAMTDCTPPGSEIIQFLSHTPALQELIITNNNHSRNFVPSFSSSHIPVVILEHLKLLVLSGILIESLSDFFARVAVNQHAAIRIFQSSWPVVHDTFPLSRTLQLDALQSVTTLSIDLHRTLGFVTLSGTNGACLPAIRLEVGGRSWRYPDIFGFSLITFPSSQIKELWFGVQGFQYKLTPEIIRGVLRSLSVMETFVFHKQYLEDIISAFCDGDPSEVALLCPNLHTIRVVGPIPWAFRPAAILDFAKRLARVRPTCPISHIVAGKVLTAHEYVNEEIMKRYSLGVVGTTNVDFEGYEEMPSPPMPDICRSAPFHRFWRPWA